MRLARPDIALSSDFIVGFPGETDADFASDPGARPRGRFRLRLTPSNIRRGPARRPPTCRPDRRSGQGRAARRRCRRCIDEQRQAFNRGLRRPPARRSVRAGRAPSPASSSAARPICRPCVAEGPSEPDRRAWRRSKSSAVGAEFADRGGLSRRRRKARIQIAYDRRRPPSLKPQDPSTLTHDRAAAAERDAPRHETDRDRARFRRQRAGLASSSAITTRTSPASSAASASRAYANGNQVVIQGPARSQRAGAARVRDCSTSAPSSGQPAERGRRRRRHRGKRLPGHAVPRRVEATGDAFGESRPASAASCAPATPRRTAISRRCASTSWCSPKARPAPARPGSRSATRCRCSSRASSSG